MFRKNNTDAIIQITISMAIACFLIYQMVSGKINYYVHPRFYVGIWISIVVLILFAFRLLSKVDKARHNVNLRHYLIFVIPLLLAIFFPASSVSGTEMTLANGSAASESESVSTISDTGNSVEDTTASSEQSDIIEETTSVAEKYSQLEVNGIMMITDDVFYSWYTDLFGNVDDFVGKKCQYVAQVYSMEGLSDTEFLAGRYFMVCCAADLAGYGIICESDIRSSLAEEEWILVTGTIQKTEYNGYEVPLLTNVTIEETEAPDTEYIYYSAY